MYVSFYNNNLRKIQYSTQKNDIDVSKFEQDMELIDGKEYICITNENDDRIVEKIFPLKSMDFEIRKIKESSTFKNTYSCSVRVLSYENGLEYPNTENVVVVGYFYNAYPEAVYESKGYWDVGKDGREVFYITERRQLINSSENSLRKFLTYALRGQGFGSVAISKLLNTFGLDVVECVKNDDSRLVGIFKKEDKRIKLIDCIARAVDAEKVLTLLMQHNISAETALDVIDDLGASAYVRIVNNPFVLLQYHDIPIEKINNIAKLQKVSHYSTDNVYWLILRYIEYMKNTFGDVYVDYSDLIGDGKNTTKFELFYDKYNIYKKFDNKLLKETLDQLIRDYKINIVQHVSNESKKCIYDAKYYEKESYIVDKLMAFKSSAVLSSVSKESIEQFVTDPNMCKYKLDSKQVDAVVNALNNKLSIISGGPGTGKTLVTKIIVDIYRNKYPDNTIQLCAPTGKASRRMSEVIGLDACTIHKKLGYGTGVKTNIDDNLLIVDECSMIDIDLFFDMLYHTSDNTAIVLVGDYNQLPSVGPGLILRDLIDSGIIPSVKLKSVFRQSNGSEIINAADAVLEKDVMKINREFGKDFVYIRQSTQQIVYNNIKNSVKYLLDNNIDASKIQILTPQNDGILGTSGLNIMMRDLCNSIGGKNSILIKNTLFYEGDRIIQTENNAELGIFNGSIGIIENIVANCIYADFDGRKVSISGADLNSIKLGYAISVHKSQGSEFEYVLMPMVNEHEYTLNKNLLYTAITRSKKMFVLFGQDDCLINTINKEIVWNRKSQIKDKLISKNK